MNSDDSGTEPAEQAGAEVEKSSRQPTKLAYQRPQLTLAGVIKPTLLASPPPPPGEVPGIWRKP